MPTPKTNESKQDFLARCTREVVAEGRDPDQAYAMCNAYWDEASGSRSALSLSAPIRLLSDDPDPDRPRGFLITAYTGRIIDLGRLGRVVFDVGGMSAKAKLPILREHARDRIVGVGSRAWRDDSRFYIAGEFSRSTQDAQEVFRLAQEGFPWQASVGIWPQRIQMLASPDETAVINGAEVRGPIEIWRESLVGEVSFVALGADDQTAAIALADRAKVQVDITQSTQEETIMTDLTMERLEADAPELITAIRDQAYALGLEAGVERERKRVCEIIAITAADVEARVEAIRSGLTLDQAYRLFFEAEQRRRCDALAAMQAMAPQALGQTPPVDHRDLSSLPIEERCRITWDKDANIRQEFDGDFEVYLAAERAINAGLARIIKQ